MHVFFNAYKCICARACPSVASERMWREECREARGGGTTLGDPLAGGSGEPLCTEARGECTVEVSPRPVLEPVGSVSHRVGSPRGGTGVVAPRLVGSVSHHHVGQSEGAVPSAGELYVRPQSVCTRPAGENRAQIPAGRGVGQSRWGATPTPRVGGPEMVEELRRSMQRRLAGFALRQICDAQDFLGTVCYTDARGFIPEEIKRTVVRVNMAIEPWVGLLSRIYHLSYAHA